MITFLQCAQQRGTDWKTPCQSFPHIYIFCKEEAHISSRPKKVFFLFCPAHIAVMSQNEPIDLSQDEKEGSNDLVSDVSEVIGGNTRPRSGKTYRHWCFTSYDEVKYDISWMKYLIVGKETCPSTGRKHNQCHVYTEKPIRFTGIKKKLPGCHIEPSIDPDKSIQYCMKEGSFQEFGSKPSQGKRTDLISIKDKIVSGVSLNTIVMEDPMAYHQYGRTMTKIEDIINSQKKRDFRPEVYWIYGPTGTGKSHSVYSKETDLYVKCFNDDKWWDGYSFQEAVLLDDYRGEMKYNDFLQFTDKYQYTVPRRGRAPIAMMAKRIYITSAKKPEEVYLDNSDNIDQLLRRIKEIIYMDKKYDGDD